MAIFKCKICGGSLDIADGNSVAVCEYCGTKQTVPTTKDEVVANLFNRANNLRLKCEFDKAEQVYEKILDLDNTDAEAHWGLVLCKYGIEYVEDSMTNTKIPTCHRTLYGAVLTDIDYVAAIENSDAEQKELYEAEAKVIDELQKNILNIVNNEEPFDVFICYKETDDDGKRTIDSSISNDIYYQLTQEGFKVFYAPITLEDKLGYEYEPYIFAALNSAKVMLVVGTKPEYFDSVWVRNEWSRYLKLMKAERSKLLIPCYKDMDAYELPDEFAHLQAQDMGKIGFISDVIRGLKKVFNYDTQSQLSPKKNKKKKQNKNKTKKRLWTRKTERNRILSFLMPKSTYGFFIFTIVFYLYSLIKIGMGVTCGHDLFMFSLTCLPFVTPLLIFVKFIKNKILAITLETVSLLWSLIYFSDIPYTISNGFFSVIVLMSLLCAVWMILVCLTKRTEGQSQEKKKFSVSMISTVFSVILVILYEIFGIIFIDYQLAKTFYNTGNYEYAKEYFVYLDNYKDSSELAKKCKLIEIKNAEFMDRVQLGNWVKGNAVYDGRDADEWYVIAKENNKVLLLSVDATASSDGLNIKGGWKNSSIRSFLNGERYENSFAEYIKERIVSTNLPNSSGATTDKLFLMSSEEFEKYLPFINDRRETIPSYSNDAIYLRNYSNNKHTIMLNTGEFKTIEYAEGEERKSTSGFNFGKRPYRYKPAMWIDISGIEN